MIEKGNVASIEYDIKNKIATFHLKNGMIIKGLLKKEVRTKCDFNKYKQFINKYL